MIYNIDGMPPLKTAIPLGLQHVLAMFTGNVAPLIIIANVLGLPVEEKTFLVQAAMFIAGMKTSGARHQTQRGCQKRVIAKA
jgi:xanthine/uracil permease